MLNKNNKVVLKYKDNKIRFKAPFRDSPIVFDETELPLIFLDYTTHKKLDTEDVVIPFFSSDFYNNVTYKDIVEEFTLRYEIDGVVNYKKINSGYNEINFGKLPKGMHWYSLQVIDSKGIESRRLVNELWIINEEEYRIKPHEIYTMTESDLNAYGINNQNSTDPITMTNNRLNLTKLFKEKRDAGFRKIVLLNGIYRVNKATTETWKPAEEQCIEIPSNFTVDLNGSTIKLHPFDDNVDGKGNMTIKMVNCFDSHLVNGILEGDYAERQQNGWLSNYNGESCGVTYTGGGYFCSFDNIVIKQISGYNVCSGQGGNYDFSSFGSWIDDLAIVNGNEVEKLGYTTCNIGTLSQKLIDSGFVVASHWLDYGGLKGQWWDMEFHFYNSNQEFIESITVYQYTRCKIPVGATHFRMTFRCKGADMNGLKVHHMKSERYFELNNVHFEDNRTCCAPGQVQHYTFNNVTFTRTGQSITACEVDFEDGWEQIQDVYFRNCEILENIGTGDIIDQAGLNMQMLDCKNFRYACGYRVHGLKLKGNTGCFFADNIGYMTGNTHRVINNTLVGISTGFTDERFFNDKKIHIFIRNNKLDLAGLNAGNGKIDKFFTIKDCNIKLSGYNKNYTIKDCEIEHYGNSTYVDEDIYVTNCNYLLPAGQSDIVFSMNVLNAKKVWTNCTFNGDMRMTNHNNFNSGVFTNCEFKGTLRISPERESMCFGQIQFNECVFDGKVTVAAKNNAKVQFNKCIFRNGIEYLYGCESLCEINDFIPNDVEYVFVDAIKTPYLDVKETPLYLTGYTLPLNIKTDLTWDTSDRTIATVDSNGIVTPVSPGIVDIIVGSTNNNVINTAKIYVTDLNIKKGNYYNADGSFKYLLRCSCHLDYFETNGKLNFNIKSNVGRVGRYHICEYDENKQFITNSNLQATSSEISMTLQPNTKYIRYSIDGGEHYEYEVHSNIVMSFT